MLKFHSTSRTDLYDLSRCWAGLNKVHEQPVSCCREGWFVRRQNAGRHITMWTRSNMNSMDIASGNTDWYVLLWHTHDCSNSITQCEEWVWKGCPGDARVEGKGCTITGVQINLFSLPESWHLWKMAERWRLCCLCRHRKRRLPVQKAVAPPVWRMHLRERARLPKAWERTTR